MSPTPRYPHVTVQVSDSNESMVIIARTAHSLAASGVTKEEIQEFMSQVLTRGYDNVKIVVSEWATAI